MPLCFLGKQQMVVDVACLLTQMCHNLCSERYTCLIYCVLQLEKAPGDITSILYKKYFDEPFCYESLDKIYRVFHDFRA